MIIRPILLLAGMSALIFTSPNAAAHPPEDMPWEAKRNSDYTAERTENVVDAQKLEAAPKSAEDIKVDATTSGETASEAIMSPLESVIKTDEVNKKGWFARWRDKREARKEVNEQKKNK